MTQTIPVSEKIILKSLLVDDDFTREVSSYIKSEYFESSLAREMFDAFYQYYAKYNKIPPRDYLEFSFDGNDLLNEQQLKDSKTILSEVYNEDISKYDKTWIKDTSESWCKERALFLAIMDSISIIDGSDKQRRNSNAIPEIVRTALGVSFDKSIGHDYLDDYQKRYEFYHDITQKFPFDLEILNKITKGGISRKTLNCVLAPTGGGKSQFLGHLAAGYMRDGYNVLYITCEMAEERISERLDANLMNVDIGDIPGMAENTYYAHIKKIQNSVKGKIIVKEYSEGTCNSVIVRNLVDDLKIKKNFVADVIVIDYINICASSRYRTGTVNSYSYIKAIAEELRGLAKELDIAMWTATQVNRDGFNNSDISIENTSESMGLTHTVDLYFALIPLEELESKGQILVKQLKNRYNSLNYYHKFILGIDRAKMKFYNCLTSTVDLSGAGETDEDSENGPDNSYGVGYGSESPEKKDKFRNFIV